MKIQESAENYLEAILQLKTEKGAVRSIDIVRHMNFSKPSVSRAVGLLRTNKLIETDAEGFIELTAEGAAIAQKIYERHEFLRAWLIEMGVAPELALEEACRLEHDISSDTFEKIKKFIGKARS